jgi:alkaline phosphatase
VGEFIRDYLDLDLESITAELKSKGAAMVSIAADGTRIPWTGAPLDESKELDELDCYHGDYKHKHKH